MFPRIEITYRTEDGRYQTAFCELDDLGICFPNEYAQDWVLRNLPSHVPILSVRIEGSPTPADA